MPPTQSFLSSFLPEEGELLWRSSAYHSFYPIPVPIQIDEQHLFVTSGYTSGSSLLRIEEQDGSLVHGDRIDYFINQQLIKALSDESDEERRVRVVIPPHKLEE